MKKILMVFGTRPEAIKMAPLIKELRQHSGHFNLKVCVTAQHREMLDQVLSIFDIVPDYDLDIMQSGQGLFDITSKILVGLEEVLEHACPDLVLVHGDTSTTFATALAAFYKKIAVGHIEAGLRTNSIYSPWPEEANRRLTGVLTHFHFAPTEINRNNLLQENMDDSSIVVTGNTVIDALFLVLERIKQDQSLAAKIDQCLQQAKLSFSPERRFVLVTGHRRENFGEAFIAICQALKQLALANPDVDIVYPVHLNPNVQDPVKQVLSGVANIKLVAPLPYEVFVYLMSKCYFIITDSGGVQEEAPSLNKPVLVTRTSTERSEAVTEGTVKLVGTDQQVIVSQAQQLLDDDNHYAGMSKASNPYGDGKACQRIVDFLQGEFYGV